MSNLTNKPIIKIDRNTLKRIFPDNESLRKFEELLRNLNDLIPEDIQMILDITETQQIEIDELRVDVDALIDEVDNIEVGAGLDTAGSYIVPTGTNYLDSSISLADADNLLDDAIGNIDTRQKIINKNINYQALAEYQLIIADATSGAINITLPNPTTCLINSVSYTIGITKKDSSLNIVNILPFASELIVGESQQELQVQGEVLNFITDGINWYLGA